MKVIDFDLQCHFGYFCLRFVENLACVRDHLSQIWNGITKLAFWETRLILKPGVTDFDLSGHFLSDTDIWFVRVMNCNWFALEPSMHLGILLTGIENWVNDFDLQDYLAISTQNSNTMPFNVALLYWSRLAKGRYTSQTWSCLCSVRVFPPIYQIYITNRTTQNVWITVSV